MQTIHLFVSSDGNDGGSGSAEAPLATLEGARDRLRALRAERPLAPGRVTVRGGTYRLSRPFALSPEDGNATYAAAAGETPVFDGGVRVEGWASVTLNGVGAWRADVSALLAGLGRPFRSLFVDGQRRARARWPKRGFIVPEAVPDAPEEDELFGGVYSMVLPEGAFDPSWRNQGDIDLRLLHLWVDERLPVKEYDPSTRLITSTHRTIFILRPGTQGWLRGRVYFENVREACTAPGEWYLDRGERALYYVPRPGETMEGTAVTVPVVYQFVRLEGYPLTNLILDVRIEGLTFRHGDWVQPAGDWRRRFDPYRPRERWFPRDSFEHFIINDKADPDLEYGTVPQAAFNVPGALHLFGAHRCAIHRCTVERVGLYGIELGDGCVENEVSHCTLQDLGAGGVNIDGGNVPSDPRRYAGRNRVTDNVIRAGGRVFPAGVGVLLCHAYGNTVAHNDVSDLRYTGISVGWEWRRNFHVSRENVIEKNHIHDITGPDILSDLGGIYTLGIQPNTVIRGNLIHTVRSDAYGAWGIYTDASSSNIVVEGNVVYDTGSEAINNNTGNCENVHRNNVFVASAGKAAVGVPRKPWEWPERFGPGGALTFVHNVVVTQGTHAFSFNAPAERERSLYHRVVVSDANCFFDATTGDGRPPGPVRNWKDETVFDWGAWRGIGQDGNSVFEDPGFADLAGRDFRLREGSAAARCGFREIDLSDVGPRPLPASD